MSEGFSFDARGLSRRGALAVAATLACKPCCGGEGSGVGSGGCCGCPEILSHTVAPDLTVSFTMGLLGSRTVTLSPRIAIGAESFHWCRAAEDFVVAPQGNVMKSWFYQLTDVVEAGVFDNCEGPSFPFIGNGSIDDLLVTVVCACCGELQDVPESEIYKKCVGDNHKYALSISWQKRVGGTFYSILAAHQLTLVSCDPLVFATPPDTTVVCRNEITFLPLCEGVIPSPAHYAFTLVTAAALGITVEVHGVSE